MTIGNIGDVLNGPVLLKVADKVYMTYSPDENYFMIGDTGDIYRSYGHFIIPIEAINDLLNTPVAQIRIQKAGGNTDYTISNSLLSEWLNNINYGKPVVKNDLAGQWLVK
ncbi:hypothetical protein [Pectinatus frisingensis]|uniref:hypothetical protein n=1 Tax=Pectinatus frisingensis TaxID=865 RepID=UPI0015F40A37|nr:hypothetical protein [Pectinatus frisingensis]